MPHPLHRHLKIVLVGTSHPGNIGATARAMSTMGFRRLTLVNTVAHLQPAAIAMASGCDEVLRHAEVCDTLAEAVADCHFVVATSARERSLVWQPMLPEQCAATVRHLSAQEQTVAIVFGRESSGLTNDELQACHAHLLIPTDTDYRSINLAQAVQILCYVCAVGAPEPMAHPVTHSTVSRATHRELEGFIQQLASVMSAVKFLSPKHPKRLMARVRRIFQRATLDSTEINILRGFLRAVEDNQAVTSARVTSSEETS